MNRRELIRMIAVVTGGVVIGGEFLVAGCKNPDAGPGTTFSEDDIAFLDEIAETIFPKTATAGAKEAKVGQFMTVMVNDCYKKDDQEVFHAGMKELDKACNKMHSHDFMKASPEHRKELLVSIEKEVKDTNEQRKAEFEKMQDDLEKKAQANGDTNFERKTMPAHYFTMMKQLTILGYFTSKEGRTSATRYEPVPGKYVGDLDYKKGDKIFTALN